MRLVGRWAVLLVGLLWAFVPQIASAAPRDLSLGIFDDRAFYFSGQSSEWFARTRAVDAQMVRLTIAWDRVAPDRARIQDPRDPLDPGYVWAPIDDAVRQADASGLRVLLTFLLAPTWAEGANRPADAPAGSWRPDPQALANFAYAAAVRYGGATADPARPGATLPRVRYWQPWNEPNLSQYLGPQWNGSGSRAQPSSPSLYRALNNAVYRTVKEVHGDNVVIAAGTAPYGDPFPGGTRMTPIRFLRALFSLSNDGRREGEREPLLADGIDHHPYATAGPTARARLAENVSVPDMGKITRLVRAALKERTLRPPGAKRLWTTEISWDSAPPDPEGVPDARRARWLQDALYILWRQGVDTVSWFKIADEAPKPSYSESYQSGLYFLDGRVKPLSARAFQFPFVVRRVSSRRIRVWGLAPPGSHEVSIQRRTAREWQRIARLAPSGARLFTAVLPMRRSPALRAAVTGLTSLPDRPTS